MGGTLQGILAEEAGTQRDVLAIDLIDLDGINGQDVEVTIVPQLVEMTRRHGGGQHLRARRCTVLKYSGVSFDAALGAFEPERRPPEDHMPPGDPGETLDAQIRLLHQDLGKLIGRAARDPHTASAWEVLRDRAELLIRELEIVRRQLRDELAAAGAAVENGGAKP